MHNQPTTTNHTGHSSVAQPRVLGRYHVLERLSAGGMGEVFLAASQGSRGLFKFVAIKRMIREVSHDNWVRHLFEKEGRISLGLSHGNLVQMYEAALDSGELFFVMEYIEGISLSTLIKQELRVGHMIPLVTALHIMIESAKALAYIHGYVEEAAGIGNGIVHQDISPQNIMLGYNGSVKLIDFGVAKASSENNMGGVVVGKHGYLAPELFNGEAASFRSDVFAFGVTMWELLAGRRLFTGSSALEVREKIQRDEVPELRSENSSIDPRLCQIVHKCLHPDPRQRYQSGAELLEDLLTAVYGLGLIVQPEHLIVFLDVMFKDQKSSRQQKTQEYIRGIMNQQLWASENTSPAHSLAPKEVTRTTDLSEPRDGRSVLAQQAEAHSRDRFQELRQAIAQGGAVGGGQVILINDGDCFMTRLQKTEADAIELVGVAPAAIRGRRCLMIVKDATGVIVEKLAVSVSAEGNKISPLGQPVVQKTQLSSAYDLAAA